MADTAPSARTGIIKGLDGALLAAIAILVSLYVASIGPYWNISPDSATYVGWAKALVAGVPYERGPVQPPVTSLVFAAVLFFFPDGYLALNATTVVLVLLSLVIVYRLLARQAGRTVALLVVLLTLASTRLYHESTQLLSEPSYMLSSLAALWLLDRYPPNASQATPGARADSDWRDTVLAGLLITAALLSRIFGLALVLAVLAREGWCVARRQRPANLLLVGLAIASLAVLLLWEFFGARESYAADSIRLLFRQGTASHGVVQDNPGPLALVRLNIDNVLTAGHLLLNSWNRVSAGWNLVLPAACLSLCLAGVLQSLHRRVTVTAIYVLTYLAMMMYLALFGAGEVSRLLVPILPLLFYFALEGARGLASWWSRGVGERGVGGTLRVSGVLLVSLHLVIAASPFRHGVADAHRSPFGAYPIKRPSNFDVQRVSMWIAQHARPDDTFASWQRNMVEVLAERRGYSLSHALLQPPDSLVTWLETLRVRYVIADHKSGVGASLLAIVEQYPQLFQRVSVLRHASLYEVKLQP